MDYHAPLEISMSSPNLTEAERQAVNEVLQSKWLSLGPKIQQFEAAFTDFTGWKHAIGVNSGTSGLHLCVCAAGVGAGDMVITTPFSFVASANVILFERAVPVFVDVDPITGNIDPALVEQAAADLSVGGAGAGRWLPRQGAVQGGRLRAVIAVDVFGQPADMDALRATADRYDLALIEDSCEALGAEYKGRKAGTLGDSGVYAFYPNKQITTGEGGMIVTDDDKAAALMRAQRNQGRSPGDTWLAHTHLGYNYRLDEMSAALGAVQMSRLEELLQAREQVAGWYNERLAELPGLEIPRVVESTTRVSWFVYVVRLDPRFDRSAIAEKLAAYGVPVRPYFVPIHLQPYMVERFGYRAGDFPITEDLGRRGMALPFSGMMGEEQVDQVYRALRACLQE
jgi:dTDP-4-amino-4,6-dideoxygalactose transaminase